MTVIGSSRPESISGSRVGDVIRGGGGGDQIGGWDGDDLIVGGPGHDGMNGGEGADTYVFAPGDSTDGDWIWFETGVDKIDLSAHGTSFAALAFGGSHTFTLPNGERIHTDFTVPPPVESDFIF